MKKINLKNSPVINPKLSIILPVYNVERYLGQCLDSILALPLTEIEVICVNDGSLDNCGEILKSYAQKDSRVKVITQKNAGLSAARNAGLEQANGEFVLFIDSDDYILYEPFLELYSQIDKYPDTDLFVTDFQMVMTNDGHPIKKPVYQIGKDKAPMVGLDNLPNMLQKRQCFWNVWRNVYRRSFLEEHSLRFKVGYLCEDVDYTTKVYLAEPRAVFLHCPFYCYRVRRKDSLMGNVSPKRIRDTVELLSDSILALDSSAFFCKQALIGQFQFEFLLTMAQLFEISKEERKEIKSLFKSKLPMLKVGNDRLAHISYVVISAMRFTPAAFILSRIKWIKRKQKIFWIRDE